MAPIYEELASPRYSVEMQPDAEQIRVKPQGPLFIKLFLAVWLTFWTFGGMAALGVAAATLHPFVLIWLCAWALGWVFAATTLAWLLFGCEILRADGSDLEITQEMLGFKKTRLYRGQDIHNLSAAAAPPFYMAMRMGNPFFKLGSLYDSGAIKFAYGARTIYAAQGLDEAEGRLIVERLARRLPSSVTP